MSDAAPTGRARSSDCSESHRLLAADVRQLSDAELDAKVKGSNTRRHPARRRRRARDVSRRSDRAAEEGMKARYFRTAAEFRRWLAATSRAPTRSCWSASTRRRRACGISYKEAVDEALCYGWIDGVKKRVDEARYTHRFTPRKAGSIWSVVNARRVRRADRGEADGEARARRVGAARSEEDAALLVREPAEDVRSGARAARSRKQASGVDVLPRAAARISAPHDVLRHERQTAGDARAPPGRAHEDLGGRKRLR